MTRYGVRRLVLPALVGAALLLSRTVGFAADGDLDPDFGSGGKVTWSLATFNSAADVALQADGKIVVVGSLSVDGLSNTMVIARYDQWGERDLSFNSIGYVTVQDVTFGGQGVAVAIQPDGRIVALGQTGQVTHGASAMFLVRYESNGEPDETFGTDGWGEPVGLVAGAGDLAVLDSGEILVSYIASDASFNFSTNVLRLLSGGGLDSSFGPGGVATLPGFPLSGQANLALRSDGRIVVGTSNAMTITPTITSAFAAGRLSAAGAVDSLFGTGGISPAFGDATYVPGASRAVALQADDRIVLAGSTGGSFALVGMNANGGLDSSFGSGGAFTDAFASLATDVVAHDGILLVTGGNPEFALARVTSSGTLDPTFGTAGRVTTSFGDTTSIATALAVQENGAIVVVGNSGDSSASRIVLARYLVGETGCLTGPDLDADGVCDVADECVYASPIARPRLVMSGFQDPGCAGRLALNALIALLPDSAIDPEAAGLRIVVRDGAGTIVVDDTLPPGAYDDGTKTGWSARIGAASQTWRFSRPSDSASTVTRAIVRRKGTNGLVKVALKGKQSCFAGTPADPDLAATIVLTPPVAADERCTEIFDVNEQEKGCGVRVGGDKISCRW